MSNYRRYRILGGTYFFTVNLQERKSRILTTHIEELRLAVQNVLQQRPFCIDAWVVLPDHMHCLWTLPVDDSDFSSRWHAIKAQFSRSLPKAESVSKSRYAKGERGIWQRRFWEHAIRDECDYEAHVNYIYINPLKHGLVKRVVDWPYSSFHRDVARGLFPEDWAGVVTEMQAGEREN